MGVSTKYAGTNDRRAGQRTPTTLRGKVFPGGVDCIIKDLSAGGACVRFLGPSPSAERVVVVIWSAGAAIEAVRRWRGEAEAGFEVLNRFDLRKAVPSRLSDVKAQWLARRSKLHRRQLQDASVMVDYRGSPRAVRLS